MLNLKIILFLIFIFSNTNSIGQETNAEKIIGCWTFKKIEFTEQHDFSEEIIKQTKNAILCFYADGKFTNTNSGKIQGNGTYKISDDGKTITQKSDLTSEDMEVDSQNDIDAKINFLNEHSLSFELDFGIMYLERK